MSRFDPKDKAAVLETAGRMTHVLSRVDADLDEVLNRSRSDIVLGAACVCVCCSKTAVCDEWIAGHEEGEGNAVPDFCPNRGFIRSLASEA